VLCVQHRCESYGGDRCEKCTRHSRGALAQCQNLQLGGNLIGDVGMAAFAQAIKPASEGGSGALPACTYIDMSGNPAGEEAQHAVENAMENRE